MNAEAQDRHPTGQNDTKPANPTSSAAQSVIGIDILLEGLGDTASQPAATPRTRDAHLALSVLYKKQGDFERALHHLEQYHLLSEQPAIERAAAGERARKWLADLDCTRREREGFCQRVKELEQAVRERDETVAELNAFAQTVAHDLKSPIAIMVTAGEIIRRDHADSFSPEVSPLIDRMVQVGYKMAHLIDDLLTFASIRRQDVTPERVDMAQAISEIEFRLRPMLTESGTELIVKTELPRAMGQTVWVEEVWVNYISNAIKYGGQKPRIEIGATAQSDGMIRYWVRDNGDGIRADQQAQLFSEFTRLEGARGQGHGLGLAIVKRIVEKLGGKVGVESNGVPGEGSTFYFTLPAAMPPVMMPALALA